MSERPLQVGFLHLGRARSGVRRYGAILAAEARRRDDLVVSEVDAGERDASLGDLRAAGARLRDVDLVHVQWKLADWGPRSGGLIRTERFARAAARPLLVTLHDVVEPRGRLGRLSPGILGVRRLGVRAARLVVHLEEERRRLAGIVPDDRLDVIPHFVEERPDLPDPAEAKAALGLTGRRVVTLLGYVTRRKGHRLLIEALPRLPDDVVALFVGSVIEGRDHVMEELRGHARDAGVAARVVFAGYVPDEALPLHLAATDVAVCPFSDMSASGALATWISTGRPIVTSDLPGFREIAAMEPGSLRIAPALTPGALADTLAPLLEDLAGGRVDPAVRRLAGRLTTARTVERYVAAYRQALADG